MFSGAGQVTVSRKETAKGSFFLTGDLPRTAASLAIRRALKPGTIIGNFPLFSHSFQKRTLNIYDKKLERGMKAQ